MSAVQAQEVVLLDATSRRQERVYQLEATDLARYATMLVGPHDAPDVVQEAFLRLFRNPTWQVQAVLDEGKFLRRITRSVVADRNRSTARRRARELKAWVASQLSEPEDDPVDLVDHTDLLHQILAQLSDRQAEVVRLYALGFGIVEIADELGIKEGTVRVYLKRSEPTIRRILQLSREEQA